VWDRAHGVGVTATGEIEVMLHRRCNEAAANDPSLDDTSVVHAQYRIVAAPVANGCVIVYVYTSREACILLPDSV
jgi:hypothetical protein